MRIISFNVNGIRSMANKSKSGEKGCILENNVINTLIQEQNPDILCLQEIKCSRDIDLACYKKFFPYIYANFSTIKKGYSGTAILCKEKPISVVTDFGENPIYQEDNFDKSKLSTAKISTIFDEGRLIIAEFPTYFVVNVYTPNSKDELARLGERLKWDRMFEAILQKLNKPIIVCGDLNCALEDIDIHNPKVHHKSAGFSDDERKSLKETIQNLSLIDTFRYKNPEVVKYSYWSNFHQSRAKNRGWRIDYILTSNLEVKEADILSEYFGSDHCPVIAEF